MGLLKMLADMDYDALGRSCEGNLSNSFLSSLDLMRGRKLQLEVLNERNPTWSIDIIDFHHYIGVKIDRRENRKAGVKEFNPFMMDLPNMTLYNKGNPLSFAASLMKTKAPGSPP